MKERERQMRKKEDNRCTNYSGEEISGFANVRKKAGAKECW
jgi:hypothetical protein